MKIKELPSVESAEFNLQLTSRKTVHVLRISSNGSYIFYIKRPSCSPYIASRVHDLQWLSKIVPKISCPGYSSPVFLQNSSNRATSTFCNLPISYDLPFSRYRCFLIFQFCKVFAYHFLLCGFVRILNEIVGNPKMQRTEIGYHKPLAGPL